MAKSFRNLQLIKNITNVTNYWSPVIVVQFSGCVYREYMGIYAGPSSDSDVIK